MAKVIHCKGQYSRASVHKLTSSKPAYEFQILYWLPKCKGCSEEAMLWKGIYPNGNYSDMVNVPPSEMEHWKRRTKSDDAKPELQLMSEYSHKIAAGDMTAQINYKTKLCNAKRWYKGSKI